MTTTETLDAYESGLITEAEAVEQAMVDAIDELYARQDSGDDRYHRRIDEARAALHH
ncbi:hypothetical protein [Aurantimonas sp. VKM B-3413]|uniref:hypothetical protein n=1 Tax=Aurantimonas sp. VKM B-3413 TaxID=2779401 RepID=UPI001E2FAEC7|nr:hypothetical protein [Aurantimonas sp. VKM B-3413]MCB8838169.1 hypothetical protein [Aurantimonas sp. VKM B-3413]